MGKGDRLKGGVLIKNYILLQSEYILLQSEAEQVSAGNISLRKLEVPQAFHWQHAYLARK